MRKLFLLILFLISFTISATPVNFYNNEINIGSQSASYSQVQLDFTTATPSNSGRILFDPSLEKLRFSHDGGTTTATLIDWQDASEDISTTGSITAVSFHGDGSNLTGLAGGGATSTLVLTETASGSVVTPSAGNQTIFLDTVSHGLYTIDATGTKKHMVSNIVYEELAGSHSYSTAFPIDNTKPQVSEGSELISATIEMQTYHGHTENAILIESGCFLTDDGSNQQGSLMTALFNGADGTTDAVCTAYSDVATSGTAIENGRLICNTVVPAYSNSSVTVTLRGGANNAAAWHVNHTPTGGINFDSTMKCWLKLTEMP